MREYRRDKDTWDVAKAGGSLLVRTGTRGQDCTRVPKVPVMDRLPFVCHCHQMRSHHPQRPDNASSTCPIKCRDPGMGEVYEFDMVKKKVTCSSCLCNCTCAFEVSSVSDAFFMCYPF